MLHRYGSLLRSHRSPHTRLSSQGRGCPQSIPQIGHQPKIGTEDTLAWAVLFWPSATEVVGSSQGATWRLGPAVPEAHLALGPGTHLRVAGGRPAGRGSQLIQLPGLGVCRGRGTGGGLEARYGLWALFVFLPIPRPKPSRGLRLRKQGRQRMKVTALWF